MVESNEGADLTTAKLALSSGFDEDREKVEAAIFFLRCEAWMMKKYMEEIRLIYLNPLNELCSGRKCTVESASKSLEPSSTGSAHGEAAGTDGAVGGGVIGTNEVAEKLQGALKTLQQGDGRDVAQNYRPVAREKTVSLADCCALYRLQTLLEAVQKLLDIQGSLDKWFENNKANVDKHKGTFKDLLTSVVTNFEMGYVLTELFAIQQVPRQQIQKIKLKYSKYIRPDNDSRDITLINKPLNKGDITSDYIRKLEGQINHFRTVVYEIARNLEIIIETVVTNVRNHGLEVNIKQVAMIIDDLPPRYRFAETINLSSFAKKLLASVPPDSENLFANFLDKSQNSPANTTLPTMKSKDPKSHSLRNRLQSKSHSRSVKK